MGHIALKHNIISMSINYYISLAQALILNSQHKRLGRRRFLKKLFINFFSFGIQCIIQSVCLFILHVLNSSH